ncbi:tetraacyldisaccharide 4'-kinase [Alkalilimnicola ehrlichii MLHE-1]|uniref:Tetraacyldisaccharide 4'-kinase n=1 Tax=Alkalilimnicola ehrlichii (strain ATCC BAA-1101 / DSM 17681 / MLHE-1) TaxID=187272 RepID=LPXK_ALKEH|nr:tetraacyldisaccharide 4'-kinase [Alkalilimnicola ehrlichii]Q0A8Q4.1 RecName: Full=Tetraacyldisaccharide 4'-kinase; AltName: Full=Lipid A 4'-kinase [Alkalilimnicola ehrlichii MLHE-1]ABI56783.1 lipid-A-disaccharide kinase [Alkalilimnicola ehrlichii MLHE-1]
MSELPAFWLRRPPDWRAHALRPLAALYGGVMRLRRYGYRKGWIRRGRLPVPVVVVGNIFVGGTGKTPLVAWIADTLAAMGRRPGIVSRGYGGRSREWPRRVAADSDPAEVGDEPLLLARGTGCPVAVGPDRVAAAQLLLAAGCDVVVSDDGLQHYRLPRALELVVCDGHRGLGNGLCLPAGPLREPADRLADVDMVISNGRAPALTPWWFELVPGPLRPLAADAAPEGGPEPGTTVHAVAGIGHPARFFATLEGLGYRVIPHPFPDHHPYRAGELRFGDDRPVIMTEKDAVKCAGLAPARSWFLPVEARPEPATRERLEASLARLHSLTNR